MRPGELRWAAEGKGADARLRPECGSAVLSELSGIRQVFPVPQRHMTGKVEAIMIPSMTQFNKPSSTKLLFQLLQRQARGNASNAQGFTLIELLVVVVILGVLGAVGYQATINQIGRANANTASNTATAVAKNCAGLQITGDSAGFSTTVDQFIGDNVTLTPTTCTPDAENTYTVSVGDAFCKFASATVQTDGEVSPSPDAFTNDCT